MDDSLNLPPLADPDVDRTLGKVTEAKSSVHQSHFVLKNELPKLFDVQLGEKERTVIITLKDEFRIGEFTTQSFSSELLKLAIKLYHTFDITLLSPSVERDPITGSRRVVLSFAEQPFQFFRDVDRAQVWTEYNQRLRVGHEIGEDVTRDQFGTIQTLSKTFQVSVPALTKYLFDLCRDWSLKRYLVDVDAIIPYFKLLRIDGAILTMPTQEELSMGVMTFDSYFGYFEALFDSPGFRGWYYSYISDFVRDSIEVRGRPGDATLNEFLGKLKVSNTQFSEDKNLAATLVGGDAVRFFTTMISVGCTNAITQMSFDIPDIEVFNIGTLMGCLYLTFTVPYSYFDVLTWRMIYNYIRNHLVARFHYRAGQINNIRHERRFDICPVLTELAVGGVRGAATLIRFFSYIGSGGMNMPPEVCEHEVDRVQSLRAFRAHTMMNRPVPRVAEAKLHIGKYTSVALTGQQDMDLSLPVLAADPITMKNFAELALLHRNIRHERGVRGGVEIVALMDHAISNLSKIREYYVRTNILLHQLGVHPLTLQIPDTDPSRSHTIPVRLNDVISFPYMLEPESINHKIKDINFVTNAWNLVADVNRLGQHCRTMATCIVDSRTPQPTDLRDDNGEPIVCELHRPGETYQREIIWDAAATFTGSALSNAVRDILVRERNAQLLTDYPSDLCPIVEIQSILTLIARNRRMFGYDTAVVYRPVPRVGVNTDLFRQDQGYNPLAIQGAPNPIKPYKLTNVLSIDQFPIVRRVGDKQLFFRREFMREIGGVDNGQGLSVFDAKYSMNGPRQYEPVAPGSVYVRLIKLMKHSRVVAPDRTAPSQILDSFVKGEVLKVNVQVEPSSIKLKTDDSRIWDPPIWGLLGYDFIEYHDISETENRTFDDGDQRLPFALPTNVDRFSVNDVFVLQVEMTMAKLPTITFA